MLGRQKIKALILGFLLFILVPAVCLSQGFTDRSNSVLTNQEKDQIFIQSWGVIIATLLIDPDLDHLGLLYSVEGETQKILKDKGKYYSLKQINDVITEYIEYYEDGPVYGGGGLTRRSREMVVVYAVVVNMYLEFFGGDTSTKNICYIVKTSLEKHGWRLTNEEIVDSIDEYIFYYGD